MHARPVEHVDGAGEWRGDRRDKNRVATVLELLDDEGRDERFLDLDQRGLPDVLAVVPRHLLGQAAEQRVARNSFQETFLRPLAGYLSQAGVEGTPDQEADHQHEEQGQDLLGGKPVRKELGEWPHQLPDRFHALEQHEDGEVDRHDNEQSANHPFGDERERLVHMHLLGPPAEPGDYPF
ncbi:hypothetical protein D3C81_1647990 [compost metagenome]